MNRTVVALNIEERAAVSQGDGTVNSAKFSGKTLHFPMGLGLILAAIRSKTDFNLSVLDNYVPGLSFEDILEKIRADSPTYILLSGFLGNYQYRFIVNAINRLKEVSPSSVVIIGGPMASCIPKLLIEKTFVDFVVIGEGEATIVDLLLKLDSGDSVESCEGIAFRSANGATTVTPARARIKELDEYPYPAYDLFQMTHYTEYIRKTGRCWEISNSRGCYAKCGYCRLTFGQKITFRPYDHILNEVRYIIENYGIHRFNFVDDNFLNSPRQVLEFVDALKAFEYDIQFRFQGRADKLTPELAKLLIDVGCFDISIGMESGSQRILDDMQKYLNVEKAAENIRGVLSLGVSIHATFIVGMPEEDFSTIKDTIDFIKYTNLPFVSTGILTPFPDTRIYTLAKERGLIPDDHRYCLELGRVYEIPYVNLTKFSDEQLIAWRDEIDSCSKRTSMVLDSGFNRESLMVP
jgi:anaerobic magnesium-protoporphyrin IX monomethyl ester cyclase